MQHTKLVSHWIFVASLFLLLACSDRNAPPTVAPANAQQTAVAATVEAEQAIAQAVAATLTAGASSPNPTATAAPPTPTGTESPAATATVPPTPTRLVIAESDVDGDDGNDFLRGSSASNGGRVVLLPGFDPAAVTDPVLFRGRMALRVAVFDSRVGETDGDGIQTVTFAIVDDFQGETVYANTEEAAPFCLFGGNDPLCSTFIFARNGLRWPSGVPIFNERYVAQIDIVADNGDETQWRWGFQIEGASDRPSYGGSNGEPADFSGAWYTNFAEVTLQQQGNQVAGYYARYGRNEELAIRGEVTGQDLRGYFGDNPADAVRFTLRDDGRTFTGSWLNRADGRERDWCGIRVGLGALPDGCGFSGDWFTISDYTPARPPTARLQQVGANVSGTFFNGSGNGTIVGNLGEGGPIPHHALSGIYTINGNSGNIRWDLLDFGSTHFVGCWVNQQGAHEWCGWRPGEAQPAQCVLNTSCP